MRVGACPEVGPPTPLVVLCAGLMHSTLLLLPTPCFGSWLFRSGSWVSFFFLYLVACNLPQRLLHTVIFGPLQFLCLLLLEENFVQVEALQHRVPGPGRSHPDTPPLPHPIQPG